MYIIKVTYFHRKLSVVIIHYYMYLISYKHICIGKLVNHGNDLSYFIYILFI